MPSLTIGGQVQEIRLTAHELELAELQVVKAGGRPLLSAFTGHERDRLTMLECRWMLWAAWHRRMPDARVWGLIAQYYADGGTFPELHGVVLDALLESGTMARGASGNGAGPPVDPPGAGASG